MKALASRLWQIAEAAVERVAGGRNAPPVHDFKSEVASIEEAPLPLPAFTALYGVLALIVIAILWAVFGRVDRIVVAEGKVVTTSPMIVMQPFTTSRILKLQVKAGDRVRKGQVLVTFDSSFARADQSSLEQKVLALTAQKERIEAELAGRKFEAGPSPNSDRLAETALFARRTAQFTAEMQARDSRRRQVQAQLTASKQAVTSLTKTQDLTRQVSAMWQRLAASNAAATVQLIVAQKDEVDADSRLATAVEDEHKLEQQLLEAEADRQAFLQQWHSDLGQKFEEVRQTASQAVEELNKARRLQELTELRSPVDAVVLELADVSEGSVLREAETLITLVPADARLRIDANIASRDVGYIKTGDAVRVKFEAYPFQRFGTIDGQLDVVSPDIVEVKRGDRSQPMFRAEVSINDSIGKIARTGIHLRAGLIATAEIKTGGRSIASYILEPIVRTTRESLREP